VTIEELTALIDGELLYRTDHVAHGGLGCEGRSGSAHSGLHPPRVYRDRCDTVGRLRQAMLTPAFEIR
jgi:hypothetical protein